MTPPTERRHFVTSMFKSLVNGAMEGYDAIETMRAEAVAQVTSSQPREAPPERPDPPAAASTCLTVSELAGLAERVGLSRRVAELERHARYSLRLVPAPGRRQASGSTQFGGAPRGALDWPMHCGTPLALIAQVDLSAISPASAPAGL